MNGIKVADFWTRVKCWLAKAEEVDEIKTVGFDLCSSLKRLKDKGKLVICPMESGKKAKLRLCRVSVPSDPGDMYFYEWEFIKYEREKK